MPHSLPDSSPKEFTVSAPVIDLDVILDHSRPPVPVIRIGGKEYKLQRPTVAQVMALANINVYATGAADVLKGFFDGDAPPILDQIEKASEEPDNAKRIEFHHRVLTLVQAIDVAVVAPETVAKKLQDSRPLMEAMAAGRFETPGEG